jgi:hypothetical protein
MDAVFNIDPETFQARKKRRIEEIRKAPVGTIAGYDLSLSLLI